MLDIRFIRENPEAVKENIKKKFQEAKLPLVDQVIALDQENRDTIQEAQALRTARNAKSKQVGMLMGQAKKDPSKLEEAEAVKAQVKANADRLAELETTLERYKFITPDDLRANFKYFLDAILPTCEECGVVMACHPDDPAWPIFGLPRIAHSQADFDQIVALHDSPSNAICLCTGSLGSNPDNDIPAIIRHFGERGRIGCLHVRNVKYLGHHRFREAAHLSSSGDLDMFAIMKAIYDTCPDTYIRPDHGRMIWNESGRPGYGLYDRALGATYLNGLWEAIDRMSTK